jgi:hypothetical protein
MKRAIDDPRVKQAIHDLGRALIDYAQTHTTFTPRQQRIEVTPAPPRIIHVRLTEDLKQIIVGEEVLDATGT